MANWHYRCDLCLLSFSCLTQLKSHLQQHAGENPNSNDELTSQIYDFDKAIEEWNSCEGELTHYKTT